MANPGKTIRRLRRERHMTQAVLAARVGVPQTRISEIELRRGPLDPALCAQIMSVLAEHDDAAAIRSVLDGLPDEATDCEVVG